MLDNDLKIRLAILLFMLSIVADSLYDYYIEAIECTDTICAYGINKGYCVEWAGGRICVGYRD